MHGFGVVVIQLFLRHYYTCTQPLIREGSAPVLRLLDQVSWRHFDYVGPKELFLNCNTPEDFARLRSLAADYQDHGLSP